MKPLANKSPTVLQYDTLAHQFNDALQVVDDVVLKKYLSNLHDYDIVPLDDEIIKADSFDDVRLFKITEMVYAKDEYATYKFASVFNALSSSDCAVFIILDSDSIRTDFYMGIRSMDPMRTATSVKETLETSLNGQFPGIKTQDYSEEDICGLFNRIPTANISIVSAVANSKDEDNHENTDFIQGLEKLALTMQGKKYTGIILANNTSVNQVSMIRKGYEDIYTQLSPFAKTQINFSQNQSINTSDSMAKGQSYGTNHTENSSRTEGYSHTVNEGKNHSISQDNSPSKVLSGIGSVSSMVGAALSPLTGGVSLVAGGVISGAAGLASQVFRKTETAGSSSGISDTENTSFTSGSSDTSTDSHSMTQTHTNGQSKGTSQGSTLSYENKTILNILKRLDDQMERIQQFENIGMWECASYFLSDEPATAEIAATNYASLMRGENSGIEVSSINTWFHQDKEAVGKLTEYVRHLTHPLFQYVNSTTPITITPCSMVSSNELAIHMGLPRKSVCGLPVIEHMDFGKAIAYYDYKKSSSTINLGDIFDMGRACSGNTVNLDRQSFTMHTFITGSTGSGKSNTVYEILRQLDQSDIHYLIIEPAKGEYKNVFGNDARVLGTNPDYSELLCINPFKFPPQTHVLEHIDRLIEIFNVCWPMYAAMPAVLKDAILQAYEVCGWDLVRSKNTIDDDLFPTFQDLLVELVDVINHSAYDNEVKSNYKGSLETRIKSLTNGLNGQIFSPHELSESELFDENVIIDLSRIGSLETKSLIMGILVMRLNEYRMAQAEINSESMNANIKHITVLEEAHHLLKRTSMEQSSEGSNVTGKSVEMISNAIAEMRTYGEGFIIADQSPNAVDMSAIRNTNTKIIMRLPDESDRRLSGKSAALKDEQLDEIAKLPKGVAVVYQNDWLEPVLCQINRFNGTDFRYRYDKERDCQSTIDGKWFKTEFIKLLLKGRVTEDLDINLERLKEELSFANLSTKNKIHIHKLLREYEKTNKLLVWENASFKALSGIVSELIHGSAEVESNLMECYSFDDLTQSMYSIILNEVNEISEECTFTLSQCLLKQYSEDHPDQIALYTEWYESIKEKVNNHERCF